MTKLHRILYRSRGYLTSDRQAAAEEIRHILAVSRSNNARDGISGALLFSEGCFAQVLEGPLHAVEAAFERIQCDERHHEMTVLQSGAVEARDFASWSMAFAGLRSQPEAVSDWQPRRQMAAGEPLLALLKRMVLTPKDTHQQGPCPAACSLLDEIEQHQVSGRQP